MKKDKIIVVEGIHDASRIKELYPNQIIYTSNGSEINKATLSLLIKLEEDYDIVLFFDPDFQGERIRKQIASNLKQPYHAFIDKKTAINKQKNKIGVEHASLDVIEAALKDLKLEEKTTKSDCDLFFLYEYKLIGHKNSKELRKTVTDVFNIGYANGKTLLNKLKQFNINKKDVIEVLNESSI